MTVSRINMFLVILLHVLEPISVLVGTVMLTRGLYVQAFPTLFVGCIVTVGLAARSIRLQGENDRMQGDFLDSITPTIQSGPPREAFRSTVPPAPGVPRIDTWHGKRGVS